MNPLILPLIDLWLRHKERRAESKAARKQAQDEAAKAKVVDILGGPMDYDKVEKQLIRDEGVRLKPYRDTVGKLTIGIGRNLDDNGIRENEALFMLRQDVLQAVSEVQTLPCFKKINEARQGVMVNLCFNMGISRLLGFKKMLAALDDLDYVTAAAEMMDSKWAKQVGVRAVRLSEQLKSGEWRN